jgi:hypothetical protein
MERVCAVSGQKFEITDEDLRFYEKIAGEVGGVPVPSLCPNERGRRRWAWRGKELCMRDCDKCGENVMSWFPPELGRAGFESAGLVTYCDECFRAEEFDALEYGREFDFERPFFEQFFEMARQVPRHISNSINNVNSEYIISSHRNKNCYFMDELDYCWDCYFGYNIQHSKNIVESIFVRDSEIGYDLAKAENCYAVFCSHNVFHCSDSAFLMNCRGCKKCLFCANLRQKEYHILNRPVSKEEFENVWKEIFCGRRSALEDARRRFAEFLKDQSFPAGILIKTEESSGNYLSNCKNVKDSYWVDNCKDCRYCTDIHFSRDCYDVNIYEGEMLYECIHAGPKGYGQICSQLAWFSSDVWYCLELRSCRDLFGCAGLKNQQYCILNRQYSKDEYFDLRARIVEHMRETGEWGEFFPIEYSPYPYNVTMAQRFHPLSREEVVGRGWKWLDEEDAVVGESRGEVPDDFGSIEDLDEFSQRVFVCAESGKKFKFVKAELKFYKQYGLPLPVVAPTVRIEGMWKKMGERRLRECVCSDCGEVVSTTFGEDFEGKILCEKCYLKVVW